MAAAAVLAKHGITALVVIGGDGSLTGASLLSEEWATIQPQQPPLRVVGIIGWPGEADDPLMAAVREVVFRLGRVMVVTLGSKGVMVFDGRGPSPVEHFVAVDAVEVVGTTVGCGDAFVAAFLAAWWSDGALLPAIEAGKAAGAAATAWLRPLPDEAYE